MNIGVKIIGLRRKGKSLRQIAEKLKCSKATVSKYCAMLADNAATADRLYQDSLASRRVERTKRRDLEFVRQTIPDEQGYASSYNVVAKIAAKLFLIQPAASQCQSCGYNRCVDCLSFHHLDRTTKLFALSGNRLLRDLTVLILEASKCVLLCANCHGEVHCGVRDISKLKPLSYSEYNIPASVVSWYREQFPDLDIQELRKVVNRRRTND